MKRVVYWSAPQLKERTNPGLRQLLAWSKPEGNNFLLDALIGRSASGELIANDLNTNMRVIFHDLIKSSRLNSATVWQSESESLLSLPSDRYL